MFNAADLIMAEETGLEVARSMPKPVSKKKNDVYVTDELSMAVAHDAYSVSIPVFISEINYMKLASCAAPYSYRLNECNWIYVLAGNEVVSEDFVIYSLGIINAVGAGTLDIYLEGVR